MIHPLAKRQRHGSVLMAIIIILIFAATGVILSTASSTYEVRRARRSYDLQQAYYAAEAGILRVVHWYNNPATAPGTLQVRDTVYPDNVYKIPGGTATWIAPDGDLATSLVLSRVTQVDAYGTATAYTRVAQVTSLRIGPPPAGVTNGVATVTATAMTDTGVEATIEVALEIPDTIPLMIPAALMSEGAVTNGGNFNVRWGQIWGQGDVTTPSQWKDWPKDGATYQDPVNPNPGVDPWFAIRTEGWIKDGANYLNGTGNTASKPETSTATSPPGGFDPSADFSTRGSSPYATPTDLDGMPNDAYPEEYVWAGHPYFQPLVLNDSVAATSHLLATHYGSSQNSFEYRENLYHNQDMTNAWPDLTYDRIKQFVIDNGLSYYRMNTSGEVIDENGVAQDFYYMFSRATSLDPDDTREGIEPTDPDAISRDEMPPVIFLDLPVEAADVTLSDGTTVAAGETLTPTQWVGLGRSLPDLQISGNDNFYYGMFFVAGDVTVNGAGNEETYNNVEMPDYEIYGDTDDDGVSDDGSDIDISWYGFLESYGEMTVSGNPSMYGAVYAEGGFSGGGAWEIWYDIRLSDENRQRPKGRVTVALWDTY